MAGDAPRIVVFSGPTATVQNSPPLITSRKARLKHGIGEAAPTRGFDTLVPQRLAAPVKVYVEAFTAHPLERDAGALYHAPDGYLDGAGRFKACADDADDVPVYEVVLEPEDGLYLLPYMARRRDGGPWESEGLVASGGRDRTRQTHYPDGSRMFEEIDRFGLDRRGRNNCLSRLADYDHVRVAPSGGYTKGVSGALRSDLGQGDIGPEVAGEDYFGYHPRHLATGPSHHTLARITNVVSKSLRSDYDGAIWLEGTPGIEETAYWLTLLVDTDKPMVCVASHRPHGCLGNDGDYSIVDAARYIVSRVWEQDGHDAVGVVLIESSRILSAREVHKVAARPGGYAALGGHGGVVGTLDEVGDPHLSYRPIRAHTHTSQVRLTELPAEVGGVRSVDGSVQSVAVTIRDGEGQLLHQAIPKVTIVKYSRYALEEPSGDKHPEVEIHHRIEYNLRAFPLSGFIMEGKVPFGTGDERQAKALLRAVYHGMPVALVARGSPEAYVPPGRSPFFIAGNNLTGNKARLLLMACMLRLGALPLPADPESPTASELDEIACKVRQYQELFDAH